MSSTETTPDPITIDRFGRGLSDLRISLTDRCNLRCTYCMPKEVFGPGYPFLKRDQWLSFEELCGIVGAFVRLGVRKIRLTGGEPLLRPGVAEFTTMLRSMPQIEDIALTTNGLQLARQAADLKAAGLDRVTVSLDALDPDISGQMNGRGVAPSAVLAGVDAAMQASLGVKINMVVERGVNDSQILPMARYFKKLGVALRFIEFMDAGNHNGWQMERVYPASEILEQIKGEFEYAPVDLTSDREVAKSFRYTDETAEFGLITSVSAPFCGGCTRARISADGKLFTCLFATEGYDLKGLVRSPDASEAKLYDALAAHWSRREDRYSELRKVSEIPASKVEMSFIGG